MSNYNTFALINCKKRKVILVTSSARKAKKLLNKGFKIEVWNNNALKELIYSRNSSDLKKYIILEKEYIRNKQSLKEHRNHKEQLLVKEKFNDNKSRTQKL